MTVLGGFSDALEGHMMSVTECLAICHCMLWCNIPYQSLIMQQMCNGVRSSFIDNSGFILNDGLGGFSNALKGHMMSVSECLTICRFMSLRNNT